MDNSHRKDSISVADVTHRPGEVEVEEGGGRNVRPERMTIHSR